MDKKLLRAYEGWATWFARLIFAGTFLFASLGKIPGTAKYEMAVNFASHYALPFPKIALVLAFILEITAGIALVVGWKVRIAAFLLLLYTILLVLIFHLSFNSEMEMRGFINDLGLIAGLIYVSVYGKAGSSKKSKKS